MRCQSGSMARQTRHFQVSNTSTRVRGLLLVPTVYALQFATHVAAGADVYAQKERAGRLVTIMVTMIAAGPGGLKSVTTQCCI